MEQHPQHEFSKMSTPSCSSSSSLGKHTTTCLGTKQFACLPVSALLPRGQKQKESAASCHALQQQKQTLSELPAPLELAFVRVEFCEIGHWPWHELRITALHGAPNEDGLLALIEFMEFALGLPHTTNGFILTYDVWELGQPQTDVVTRILQWTWEPDNASKLRRLCYWWKVIVPEGACFQIARLLLNSVFYLYPPTCLTYLVSNTEGPPRTDAICFTPACEDAEVIIEASSTGHAVVGGELAKHEVLVSTDENVAWTDLGFAKICRGYSSEDGMGFIKIVAQGSEITDEGLTQMMSTLDEFVASDDASSGFSITYDVRSLNRIPPMHMVTRVAEWGNEPNRQRRWQRQNLACKVVVPSGVLFTLMKGLLATFFFLCPPVCRTFLLTDPDQAAATATVFEPGSGSRNNGAPVCRPEEELCKSNTTAQDTSKMTVQNDGESTSSEDLLQPELLVLHGGFC